MADGGQHTVCIPTTAGTCTHCRGSGWVLQQQHATPPPPPKLVLGHPPVWIDDLAQKFARILPAAACVAPQLDGPLGRLDVQGLPLGLKGKGGEKLL